jgi:hypothetical protein
MLVRVKHYKQLYRTPVKKQWKYIFPYPPLPYANAYIIVRTNFFINDVTICWIENEH